MSREHNHSHEHEHEHEHDHHAGLGHSHAPKSFGGAFALATLLNFAFVGVQVFYGFTANSVALLADAAHNFADALGLLIAWIAHILAARLPTRRYTYGLRSVSILSALANGAILLVTTGGIVWEAVSRFFEPGEVAASVVMIVAALGIVVNGASAWLLMAGQKDLNIRGAFLHLVGDAAVSAGVVGGGAVILLTGWHWVDPLISLVISVVIVVLAWGLLKEATNLSLDAVPRAIDPEAVRQMLDDLPGVESIHDLHIWAMSTAETALTVHLVMSKGHPGDLFIKTVCNAVRDKFGIGHATVQIETGAVACHLAPDHVV
jgi:cobalt-zinc-cadmium efflux system protein